MKEKTTAVFESVRKRFEDDPITTTIVAAMALGAAAKLIDALSAAQGRRAYAKQVNYKVKKGNR